MSDMSELDMAVFKDPKGTWKIAMKKTVGNKPCMAVVEIDPPEFKEMQLGESPVPVRLIKKEK